MSMPDPYDMYVMRRIDEHKALIKAKKKEMTTAGLIHKKDLSRQVKRLEKELRAYIGYQKGAARISA